jgi:uncharacterized protein YhbP (UPF0306 family)
MVTTAAQASSDTVTATAFYYFHHYGILTFLLSAHVTRKKKSISEVAVTIS